MTVQEEAFRNKTDSEGKKEEPQPAHVLLLALPFLFHLEWEYLEGMQPSCH
jgi:hypothetical protein